MGPPGEPVSSPLFTQLTSSLFSKQVFLKTYIFSQGDKGMVGDDGDDGDEGDKGEKVRLNSSLYV